MNPYPQIKGRDALGNDIGALTNNIYQVGRYQT